MATIEGGSFMFRRVLFLMTILITLAVLSGSPAFAVPHLMNYQGLLTNSSGDPITTTVSVDFAIYDDSTGGNILWTETQNITPDLSGRFNVILGIDASIPDSAFVGSAFLSVSVDGDPEIQPRTQIIAVGYSYRVGTVDSASGGTIVGNTIISDPSGRAIELNVEDDNPVMVIKDPGGGVRTARFGGADTLFNGFDDDDALRISGTINSSEGAVISYFDSLPAIPFSKRQAGFKKLDVRQDSIVMFGEGGIDSNIIISSDGNILATGTITMGDANLNMGVDANVLGSRNTAAGDSSTVGGGNLNTAGGRLSTVSGGQSNSTMIDLATVSGGMNNVAGGIASSVGGGEGNNAAGNRSRVGGGTGNFALGMDATIAGGAGNITDGDASSIGGGIGNSAAGIAATVPGGENNSAQGNNSFAAGYFARANHDASVVIAANSANSDPSDSISSGCPEQMVLRADNGFHLTNFAEEVVCIPAGVFLNTATGAHLSTGGMWINASDRNAKENFSSIDRAAILEKLARLQVDEWNYIAEPDETRHIGPTAQDFYALFGLGTNDKTIGTADPVGIALAAIQELEIRTSRLAEQQKRIDELAEQVGRLSAELDAVRMNRK